MMATRKALRHNGKSVYGLAVLQFEFMRAIAFTKPADGNDTTDNNHFVVVLSD